MEAATNEKKILGLDLGTNSIGWSVVAGNENDEGKLELTGIEASGSRIIPMDAAMLGDFDKGNTVSQTQERTGYRGIRRLLERYLLRRERLHRVLDILGFLPRHYSDQLTRYGKFKDGCEPKLAWKKEETGKPQFIFQQAFNEMLDEFKQTQPKWMAGNRKVPYDWTIYYLRKKALTKPLTKEELAWVLLQFNQKRGYNQARGEEEENDVKKQEEYLSQKIVRVEATDEKKGKDIWYNVHMENGMIYRRSSAVPLDWEGMVKDFIVTTTLDENGQPKKDKEGHIVRSFRAPKPDDWTLLKKKTEASIQESGMTVGSYIYSALLANPSQKIKGKLVRTIERKMYKDELHKILEAQRHYIPELNDAGLYEKCIMELYPQNDAHRNNISKRDFTYLLTDDVLFYQRPLKSKKSLISDCPYEKRHYIENGELKTMSIKCAPKSHPRYQEFRLWQFISNLRIYDLDANRDITDECLPSNDRCVELFDYLNNLRSVKQEQLLTKFFKIKKPDKNSPLPYRWNYVEDKEYPCNETRYTILSRLKKAGVAESFLTIEHEEALWHILYSISDKQELAKALITFAAKNGLDAEAFKSQFFNTPPFNTDYAAYSLKAINKLLPLMRRGKLWDRNAINPQTIERISKLINGEYDDRIDDRTREKANGLSSLDDYQGLPTWMACYVVYGRHSEAQNSERWEGPDDIDRYLNQFRQHSLRNPVVEQVVTETLRVVRDIWRKVGRIDEIHVELGREMKNPADKRKKMTERITQNENANLRIKALLTEFLNPDMNVENIRPYSPSQQELMRIYEDGALNDVDEIDPDIDTILKKFNESDVKKRPTHSEVLRYRMWLEQKYKSPYTGQFISLAKLFTPQYEIEHVIPQSRYFDDSLSNKVICEAEVNKLKGNQLGYEFIKNHHGEKVTISGGGTVEILELNEYESSVKKTYKGNRTKMNKLLMEDLPDGFIERQLNDSRYISKFVVSLLSNIVREKGEEESTSKNIITCTGQVTDRLKHDWGASDVWNRIILPRFERLNNMLDRTDFTATTETGHLIPDMPLEFQRGFSKKRIDHRHHAMDATVIACATRSIVNYLNNESACHDAQHSRQDLQRAVCHKTRPDDKGNYQWVVNMPWSTFPASLYDALSNIIVSFKQNLRVINRTKNHIQKLEGGKRINVVQTKGDNWAIRKPMHKETVFGEINLKLKKEVSLKEAVKNPDTIVDKELKKQIKSLLASGYDLKRIQNYFEEHKEVWNDFSAKKISVFYYTKETNDHYFATRKSIDQSFDRKTITDSITDTGIQKIMLRHLDNKGGDPVVAFSPEGIEEMNRNIRQLNDGKWHQPILKVRWYEKADKFAVGQTGNKPHKFVEAAKGTNLFYAVYEDEKNNRDFATIPLNVAIDLQKRGLPIAGTDGRIPTFILSPGDLVYLPREGETVSIENMDRNRIYKMVSCGGIQGSFVPMPTSTPVINKVEYSSQNKMMRAISGEMIKDTCLPIHVNRLGEITKIGI